MVDGDMLITEMAHHFTVTVSGCPVEWSVSLLRKKERKIKSK